MAVNYLLIIIAAIVSMLIGSFWYSPLMFGNLWMKLSGLSSKDLDKVKKRGMGKIYLTSFISTLVLAYVLNYIISYFGEIEFITLIFNVFLIWLGFIATTMLSSVLWEGKKVSLYLLNITYQLFSIVVMSIIFKVWS